jgi:sarcosine oxidase subunit alpha
MDDGTVARLDDELFYVTTTSTGSEGVVEWFEWWNAIWGYDVEIVNVTGALAAMNLAGPRARAALAPLTEADLANESFRYLDAKEITVAGVACLALRIGFVGELGYELHCPATDAGRLWDALVAAGATPFGLEAQRVLRLEKGHVIVGQDTDSESNLLSTRMGWTIKDDKPDFVGKPAVPHLQLREKLVGFTTDLLPPEGAQVVRDGRIAGRVTSSRVSERVGTVVGLAWVDPDCAEDEATISVRIDGTLHSATVSLAPFYDSEGALLRS